MNQNQLDPLILWNLAIDHGDDRLIIRCIGGWYQGWGVKTQDLKSPGAKVEIEIDGSASPGMAKI